MSAILFENARVIDPSRGLDETGSVLICDGKIVAAGADARNQGAPGGAEIIDLNGKAVLPGLVDARVFVGEPGAEHRETIASASRAAAAGGVTSIIMMPDTDPVIDDVALVEFVKRTARDTAVVNVHPATAISPLSIWMSLGSYVKKICTRYPRTVALKVLAFKVASSTP